MRLSGAANKKNQKGFLVVWLENELGSARLGITVSKKIGPAVVRNRIKRLVRETYRILRHQLPTVDINVIARRECAYMDHTMISREINNALISIGAIPCSKLSCSS
jgi:ribonuclease P protein component